MYIRTWCTAVALSAAVSLSAQEWRTAGTNIVNNNNGNVGIGTETPAGKLSNTSAPNHDGATGGNTSTLNWETAAPGYSATIVNSGVSTYANGLLVKTTDTFVGTSILKAASGGNVTRFVVTGSGAVGINTNTPSQTHILDVVGAMRVWHVESSWVRAAANTQGTPVIRAEQLDGTTGHYLFQGTTAGTEKFRVDRAGNGVFAGDVSASGTITANNVIAKYQDLAEWVPSSSDLEPGTVVVLHPRRVNEVIASSEPYDVRVAGVVSAQPGIALGEAGASKELVATTARVRVRVDATAAPIRIGDLLVTSSRPGMAMRSEPVRMRGRQFHQPGTIIGKALEPLDSGEGTILVLLSLQ